jgi:hypothetical protein
MVQLTNLELRRFNLQLQAGGGFQSIFGVAALPLKQLQLHYCTLLIDETAGLAGALSLLTGLEYLSIHNVTRAQGDREIGFPTEIWQSLQQLTHLEVAGWCESNQGVPQSLQALTRLAHLRIESFYSKWPLRIDADTLSSSQLTHVELPSVPRDVLFTPGVLAGKTQLQHLQVPHCSLPGGAADVSQLLSELQHLQQLTHLDLSKGLRAVSNSNPPAAAYASLTASSNLQHLDVRLCTFPTGVWEHVFPADRQLPHLQLLQVSGCRASAGGCAAAPDCSRLARCCPGLQSVYMIGLKCGTGQLAALSRLTGLRTLHVTVNEKIDDGVWDCCCLTGLRELELADDGYADSIAILLELTRLRQLTRLAFTVVNQDYEPYLACESGETQFRQVSLGLCDHIDAGLWIATCTAMSGVLGKVFACVKISSHQQHQKVGAFQDGLPMCIVSAASYGMGMQPAVLCSSLP